MQAGESPLMETNTRRHTSGTTSSNSMRATSAAYFKFRPRRRVTSASPVDKPNVYRNGCG